MRICILGTGLSSLTLAKALVNQNIYVDIVAPTKKNIPDKSRTIGISKSNIEFFNNSIINVDKIRWKLKKIEIFTDNLKKEKLINFEDNGNELFSIIKNYKISEILEKSLFKNKYFKKVNIIKGWKILKNYNLVITADFNNPITKKFFSKKIIKKYYSFAYTTIIRHQNVRNNTAVQIFTKQGPLAFLPISNRETSIVYSLNDYNKKKSNDILELIHKYNFKYKIKNIDQIKFFELNSLNLRSYYNGNILAFGDLLHKIHPLAGQGFNMTIRDTKFLINIINNKKNLGLPLDYSVNIEFEKKLKHNNFIFSSGIDFVYEFFNFERKINTSMLSKSVQYLGNNPSINKLFTKIADEGIIL